MAGSINNNNYNVGANYTQQTTKSTAPKQEVAQAPNFNTDDAVSIGGFSAAPSTEGATFTATPQELPSFNDAQTFTATPTFSSPSVLTMGGVTDSKSDIDFSQLTGVNSLGSIVSTGSFMGLKGSYGAKNPFAE